MYKYRKEVNQIKIIKYMFLILRIFDFNLWYEKLIYLLAKINKIGTVGRILSIIFNFILRLIFNCDISPDAHIGKKVKIPHAVGIVIGGTAVIGDKTVIMPNVVIGSKYYPPNNKKRHATIGDNCIIGAGAKVTKNLENNSTLIQI